MADTDGTDIRALRLHKRYDEGVGPLIVLLHGINADAREWRPVIDAIGPGHHCIAFDLLGFGESPQPLDLEYSADQHALVLENTVRDLHLEEPFALVGFSLGGDIAMRYASRYPHRVQRLFLLSAPFYLPPDTFSPRGFSGHMIQAMLMRWAWAFLARGRRDSTAFYELAVGRLHDLTRQLMRTDQDLPTRWEIMSRNLANCISKSTFVDDLPGLTMPTVFALGIRDPIVRPDQTLALRRLKPDLEVRRIVGWAADHMLPRVLPERVAREIVRDEIGRLSVPWRGGAGEPLAILVGPEGAAAWRPLAESLAGRFDVALIDLLGFGGSPTPLTARYDLGDHVAAVRATARALWPADAAVRVVGHGLGATVGLGFRRARPGASAARSGASGVPDPPGARARRLGRFPRPPVARRGAPRARAGTGLRAHPGRGLRGGVAGRGHGRAVRRDAVAPRARGAVTDGGPLSCRDDRSVPCGPGAGRGRSTRPAGGP